MVTPNLIRYRLHPDAVAPRQLLENHALAAAAANMKRCFSGDSRQSALYFSAMPRKVSLCFSVQWMPPALS